MFRSRATKKGLSLFRKLKSNQWQSKAINFQQCWRRRRRNASVHRAELRMEQYTHAGGNAAGPFFLVFVLFVFEFLLCLRLSVSSKAGSVAGIIRSATCHPPPVLSSREAVALLRQLCCNVRTDPYWSQSVGHLCAPPAPACERRAATRIKSVQRGTERAAVPAKRARGHPSIIGNHCAA